MNTLPSDINLNTPSSTMRGNKSKPQIVVKKRHDMPEKDVGIACPSPISPKFQVNFLQNDELQGNVNNHLRLDGASQVKALLDTGKDGRSVLGRKFPKSVGKLCNPH
jgi:hypothetical protein